MRWMKFKRIPKYMREAYVKCEILWEGDYLHTAKCRKCNREYWTIIHESTGICPECENK